MREFESKLSQRECTESLSANCELRLLLVSVPFHGPAEPCPSSLPPSCRPCGPLPFLIPHRPLRPAGLPHRPRAPAAGPACGPNPLCAGPACRRRRCPPVIAALLRAGRRSCRAPRWSGTAERKGFFIGDSDNPSPPSRSRRLPGGRQRSGRAPCWSGTAEKREIFSDNPSPSRDASLQRRVLPC